MQKIFALLEKLQDGRSHSGQDLADEIGVTRAAIWQQIKNLQEMGIEIHAVSGKGYRLPGGYEFLDAQAIRDQWTDDVASSVSSIEINQVIDSTNERLLVAATHEDVHGRACLTEYQTAGRGRRGARWLAPPGSGLCLSLAWRFTDPPEAMGALSLVVGLATRRALLAIGADAIQVKWPNDIYIEDERGPAKIAGILIELRSELAGPSMVVIGLGINIHISQSTREQIDQSASDLASVCDDIPGRNATASSVIAEIVQCLKQFEAHGFGAFAGEWREADFLRGRKIKLHVHDSAVVGEVLGVNDDGLLKLNVGGEIQTHFAGHVELLSA
ncbi:MAG: biotin--[acetyl-CoA-carboxylase] ligase [Gammaproteobacteria bacterium]